METLWKNSLTIAKRCMNHQNKFVFAVTFSEKKIGGISFMPPLVVSQFFLMQVPDSHGENLYF
jgi:hypothetical protein